MTKSMTLQLTTSDGKPCRNSRRSTVIRSARSSTASLYYLADRDSGRPAWRAPRFARTSLDLDGLEIDLDDDTFAALRQEASGQGSSRRGWLSTRCSTTWPIWTADDSPNGSAEAVEEREKPG